MSESLFEELFGHIAKARVFIFLLSHPIYEYTVKEIAEYTELPEDEVEKVIDKFREYGMIEGDGRYRVNMDSPIVKAYEKFDMEIAKWMVDKERGGKNE